MARQFFGTDGVRGTVGEAPITPDFVLLLGQAAGRVCAPQQDGSRYGFDRQRHARVGLYA